MLSDYKCVGASEEGSDVEEIEREESTERYRQKEMGKRGRTVERWRGGEEK